MKAARLLPTEPLLVALNWLPVEYQIKYTLAIISLKALTTRQQTYLADILHHHVPVRQSRSTAHDYLVVPQIRI